MMVRPSLWMILCCCLAGAAWGQEATGIPTDWQLYLDGQSTEWPLVSTVSADTLQQVARVVLKQQQRAGYYFASVDSVRVDSVHINNQARLSVAIYLTRDSRVEVGEIHLHGITRFDPRGVLDGFSQRSGQVLEEAVLEADLEALLAQYDEIGYVLAQAKISDLILTSTDPPTMDVHIQVTEGQLLELADVVVQGGRRTTPDYVARVAGLKKGRPLLAYDPEAIRRRLEETGIFKQIHSIGLGIDDNRKAVLRVQLDEDAPGAFDVVLGYLPGAQSGDRGSLVGNINVLLRHVLGGGREFGFQFNRLPNQITRIKVQAGSPFMFGLPFRIGGHFDGLQQDSTYGTRQYGFESGYRVAENLETIVSLSREVVRPTVDSLTTVPSADAWFVGVGFQFQHLDRRLNPSRGWRFASRLEEGRKVRLQEDPTGALVDEVLRQRRLTMETRTFVPTFRRQVLVVGADAYLLQSDRYDESELFRLGGAKSMRGYNEEQFQGNVVGRAVVEWRYLLDRTSFLFAFTDVGYLRRPDTDPEVVTPEVVQREWLVGYGFGIQFGTNAGLFTLSLALNADEGLSSKVHVGMTLGL